MSLYDDWESRAPCRDSLDHFPYREEGNSAVRIRRAKRVCVKCPFRIPCLVRSFGPYRRPEIFVQEDGTRFQFLGPRREENQEGIWGGTTWAEREAVMDLPLVERVRLLDLWVRTQTTGRFAVARREEMAEMEVVA